VVSKGFLRRLLDGYIRKSDILPACEREVGDGHRPYPYRVFVRKVLTEFNGRMPDAFRPLCGDEVN